MPKLTHSPGCPEPDERSLYIRLGRDQGRAYKPVGTVCTTCKAAALDVGAIERMRFPSMWRHLRTG